MDGIDCTYTAFGDITADGKVDIRDIYTAARAFGSYADYLRSYPISDVNCDLKVNIAIAKQFGKTDCQQTTKNIHSPSLSRSFTTIHSIGVSDTPRTWRLTYDDHK
jgi:hypothetical protein